MGLLVQQPQAFGAYRQRAARRSGSRILRSPGGTQKTRRLTQTKQPPANPGRFKAISRVEAALGLTLTLCGNCERREGANTSSAYGRWSSGCGGLIPSQESRWRTILAMGNNSSNSNNGLQEPASRPSRN